MYFWLEHRIDEYQFAYYTVALYRWAITGDDYSLHLAMCLNSWKIRLDTKQNRYRDDTFHFVSRHMKSTFGKH